MRILKIILISAVFCGFTLSVFAEQAALGRADTLLTSFDPERQVNFTVLGDTVHAEGFFADSKVIDFFIFSGTLNTTENNLSVNADGTFSGYYGGSAEDASSARVAIGLEDGSFFYYLMKYCGETGWYFPDNGLGEKTMQTVLNYYEISPEISAYYVSASLCPDEIGETLYNLRAIVLEQTAGLECEYQKAKALNTWVAENIYYDLDARNSDVTEETVSIATTLRLRRSVCIGITNLYIALLEVAGIKAVNIKGGVVSPPEGVEYEDLPYKTAVHEWVAFWFEAEDRWVFADPTWDRKGLFQNGEYVDIPAVYKHFDITPLALSFDHRGDRAELRQYFTAWDGVPYVPPENPDNPESPGEPDNIAGGVQPAPVAQSNALPYVLIALMILTAIAVLIMLFKSNSTRS